MAFSAGHVGCSESPTSSMKAVGRIGPYSLLGQNQLLELLDGRPSATNVPVELPPSISNPKVYMFPTFNKKSMRMPSSAVKELLELFDPILEKVVEDPLISSISPMYTGDRVLTIRRSKMNKHKRRKRERRDRFQLFKYHREQKAKSERLFRERMQKKLAELKTFDAEAYVRDVIARAKRDWKTELAPSGRKKYPHWSTLISLEELYDLPASDYIDKRAGIPSEEDKERIRQLKKKYYKEFRGEDIDVNKDDEKKEK